MNIQKLLIATVASFVVMFGLGGLIHMGLIENWMMEHGSGFDAHRDPPFIIWIGGGVLVLSFLMSYIYPKGMDNSSHIMQGLKFGVIIGLLWTLPYSIVLFGSTKIFSLANVGMGALVSIIVQGLGGVVIAMVYGKKSS